jgi:hypothetical protein
MHYFSDQNSAITHDKSIRRMDEKNPINGCKVNPLLMEIAARNISEKSKAMTKLIFLSSDFRSDGNIGLAFTEEVVTAIQRIPNDAAAWCQAHQYSILRGV